MSPDKNSNPKSKAETEAEIAAREERLATDSKYAGEKTVEAEVELSEDEETGDQEPIAEVVMGADSENKAEKIKGYEKPNLTNLVELVDKLAELPLNTYIYVANATGCLATLKQKHQDKYQNDGKKVDFTNIKKDSEASRLIDEVKKHLRVGHDPFKSAEIQLNPVEDTLELTDVCKKGIGGFLARRKNRIGRARAVNRHATKQSISVKQQGYEYSGEYKYGKKRPIVGKVAVALAFLGIETKEVREEKMTLNEYYASNYDKWQELQKHVDTQPSAPNIMDIMGGFGESDPMTLAELTNTPGLVQADEDSREEKFRNIKDKARQVTRRLPKHDLKKKGTSWNKLLDSYHDTAEKSHKNAVSGLTEYDINGEHHYTTHEVLNYLKVDASHNRREAALLTAVFEADYSDKSKNFLDVDPVAVSKSANQLADSVDLANIKEGYAESAKILGKIIDGTDRRSGFAKNIWKKFMKRNGNSEDEAKREIAQVQKDLIDAIPILEKQAETAKAVWEKKTDLLETVFNENKVKVNGNKNKKEDKPKSQYFTFQMVPLSKIEREHAGKQWGFERNEDGIDATVEIAEKSMNLDAIPQTRAEVAMASLKKKWNNIRRKKESQKVDYAIEVQVHIPEEEKNLDGDAHKTGRVVGYIDPRTGSVMGYKREKSGLSGNNVVNEEGYVPVEVLAA